MPIRVLASENIRRQHVTGSPLLCCCKIQKTYKPGNTHHTRNSQSKSSSREHVLLACTVRTCSLAYCEGSSPDDRAFDCLSTPARFCPGRCPLQTANTSANISMILVAYIQAHTLARTQQQHSVMTSARTKLAKEVVFTLQLIGVTAFLVLHLFGLFLLFSATGCHQHKTRTQSSNTNYVKRAQIGTRLTKLNRIARF